MAKKDNRRVITWTLNETNAVYRNAIKNYNHKIYSIGLHEFEVTALGKIRDYNTKQYYFNSSGNHTGIRFPIILEQDMLDYPSIKWFMQMIVFGWESTVKPILDNNVRNSEGRLPQDQFVYELNKLLDLYSESRSTKTPLKWTGIEMDVEGTMTSDPYSVGYDEKYIQFLQKIKREVCDPRGLKLRVNAHAMWGENVPYYYRFHNYKLFAESTTNGKATIDEIQLMTYDFHWSGSSAGASTPIWWFEQVAEWCKKCFDPKENPKAKLTIDNLYFGAAAYGNRWGMHKQEVVKSGRNVTYHNLLGWQNGYYRHYHTETNENGWTNPQTGEKYRDSSGNLVTTRYVYENQEMLPQISFQDEESKNEVMYPHVYDMFKPKYAEVVEVDGYKSVTVGTYNRQPFATTYSRIQTPIWTNVIAIANNPTISGKAYRSEIFTIKKTINGTDYNFNGYYTEKRLYVPKIQNNGTVACVLQDDVQDGRITFTVNVPQAGNYKLIAITSFQWFTQTMLGGYVNGSQRFTVGGDLPEWYPFILKESHFFDCGRFNFNSGQNTITIHGELSHDRTYIFGFVICQDFNQNLSGGELKFKTNVQRFTKKDGTKAAIPNKFALAWKMLRRDARPAILWDDEFRTYGEGTVISNTTYYQHANDNYFANGNIPVKVGENKYECRANSSPQPIGYSQGIWKQQNYRLYFNSDETESRIGKRSGQLILSKQWSVNLSIEATINVQEGSSAGIRFYAQKQGTVGDGYIFLVDFKRGVKELILEENIGNGNLRKTTIASQALGDFRNGMSITFKVLLYNGVGRFYLNGIQAFVAGTNNPVTHDGSVNTTNGTVQLQRRSGACGIYANDAVVTCTHFGVGTLDRWETMEKFEVTIDGKTYNLGRINRTGYQYDEYGYLIYSGLDEKITRDKEQYPFEEDSSAVSLDYEVTVIEVDSWEGSKEITLKFRDAGVWFGELLIGDRNGMSVIWTGDAWSFLNVLNLACGEYGAKGIGLWTMGQEDPKIWQLVPDVVPKKT